MEIDQEKYSFILAWSASIWKRILNCVDIYSKHQNLDINADIVMKCLKYNILSPTGIAEEMLPSLKLALTQGFLLPKEYEKNKYVKRAVSLFGEAYNISKIPDKYIRKKKEKEFIKQHSCDIDKNEEKDILKIKSDKKDAHCSFCQLVKVWDIELGLYTFKNPYHSLLIYTLLSILD